jgi:hypothetical protein
VIRNFTRRSGSDLGNAQLDHAVDTLLGEINIVYPNDLAPARVDDLLVQQVLAHGQPGFVRLVMFETLFLDVQANHSRGHERDVIVAHD